MGNTLDDTVKKVKITKIVFGYYNLTQSPSGFGFLVQYKDLERHYAKGQSATDEYIYFTADEMCNLLKNLKIADTEHLVGTKCTFITNFNYIKSYFVANIEK